MFEAIRASAVADSRVDAAGDAREEVAVELVELDPVPAVELFDVEANALLVVTHLAAVKEEQELVAFAFMGFSCV